MHAHHADVLLTYVGHDLVPGKYALGSMLPHNQQGTQKESIAVTNLQWCGLMQNYEATLNPCAYLWSLDMRFLMECWLNAGQLGLGGLPPLQVEAFRWDPCFCWLYIVKWRWEK
eukprot:7716481-Ditylum_brightwellii.AAC.1